MLSCYFRIAIVITDGQSRWPPQTASAAQLVRGEGTKVAAIGINEADQDELLAISGQADLVNHVATFDDLSTLVDKISHITCKVVIEWEIVQSKCNDMEMLHSSCNKNLTFVLLNVQL